MKTETYTDLVELLRSNALFKMLADCEYYGDDDSERNNEALNIVFEFVMAVPEWHQLVAAELGENEDPQMLQLWFMDAVLIEHKDTVVVVEVPAA